MEGIDVGTGTAGALRAMWRDVYQKASAVARATVDAWGADHVQRRHGRRALCIVLDGGGAALTTGQKVDVELPWAYQLEGWALYADASGSLVVGLSRSAGLATYPGDLASLTAAAPPTLSGAQKARSEALTGWTTALARGNVLRVSVTSASTITVATLTLFLRAI